MGTLDDAIREHLELKKRSGASEEEVKRLESEAFGPVRREPVAPAPHAAGEDDLEPPTTVVASEPQAEPEGEAALDEQEVAPPEPFLSAPPPAPATSRSWLEDEIDAADPPPQSTSEFSAAEAEDASGRPPSDHVAPDDEGEDLLEETPDFLQETPEHDRLWFEQRPPRDFDFDE